MYMRVCVHACVRACVCVCSIFEKKVYVRACMRMHGIWHRKMETNNPNKLVSGDVKELTLPRRERERRRQRERENSLVFYEDDFSPFLLIEMSNS